MEIYLARINQKARRDRRVIIKTYPITPIAKPRMTQRDKWKKRPCAERYYNFKDMVKLNKVYLPLQNAHIIFKIPMPKSWSGRKRALMDGKLHRQKPDWDNLGKALSDAVYDDDSKIADIRITKRWAVHGAIEIRKADEII